MLMQVHMLHAYSYAPDGKHQFQEYHLWVYCTSVMFDKVIIIIILINTYAVVRGRAGGRVCVCGCGCGCVNVWVCECVGVCARTTAGGRGRDYSASFTDA